MSETNIIDIVKVLMEEAENMIDLKGPHKKAYVLNSIKALIGDESYYKNYNIISYLIEFMVDISNGLRLDINRNKNIFCCI